MAAKKSFIGHTRGLYQAIKKDLDDKYDQQVLDELTFDILQQGFIQGYDGEGVIGMKAIVIVKYHDDIIDFIVSKYYLASEKYRLERFTHADTFVTGREKR